jgi:hypothetical protein
MPFDNPSAARRKGFIPGTDRRIPKNSPTAFNPSQGKIAPIAAGGGFNKQAAGSKTYGAGRPFPNMGRTTSKAGYGKRDAQNARANAIQKRLGGM